jgi:hypothetical protein
MASVGVVGVISLSPTNQEREVSAIRVRHHRAIVCTGAGFKSPGDAFELIPA